MILRCNDRRRGDVRYQTAAAKCGRMACVVDAVCEQWPDGYGVLPARVGQSGELLPLAIAAGHGSGCRPGSSGQRITSGTDRVCRSGPAERAVVISVLRGAPGYGWRVDAASGAPLMFFPEGQIRVQLYGAPVDMRKSFDGLSALAEHAMGQNPLSGQLFVFINRRATQIKVLYFDRSGFCVWAKRLEAGRFLSDWRTVRSREMDWTAFKLLLEGIEPGRQRKRFRLGQSSSK
ncbi:MAG: transposase [Rhodanobacter sp.]|nr:MAG: transposase [Rhodanobacter sp.]